MSRRVSSVIRALVALVVVSVSLSPPALGAIRRALKVEGIDRVYWVDPGRDAATTPSPLVLVFHGLTATATEAMSFQFAAEWPEAMVVPLLPPVSHYHLMSRSIGRATSMSLTTSMNAPAA